MTKHPRILVDGYLSINLGDDLFFSTLFERYPSCRFMLLAQKEYEDLFAVHKNVTVYNRGVAIRVISKLMGLFGKSPAALLSPLCDIAVIIGGSIFIDPNEPKGITFGKTPLFVIGSNYGPERSTDYRKVVSDFFSRAHDVCLRDLKSYGCFSDLENVRYAPDTIFGIDLQRYIDVNKRGNTFISVINLDEKFRPNLASHRDDYESYLAGFIVGEIRGGRSVTLVSFCKSEGDEEAVRRVASMVPTSMGAAVSSLFYRGNPEPVLTAMGSSDKIVGSRFHSIVLGLAMGKEVYPISYSGKTEEMLGNLNKGCMRIEDLGAESTVPPISLTSAEIDELRKSAQRQFLALDAAVWELEKGRSKLE